jgi:hypothetical protein
VQEPIKYDLESLFETDTIEFKIVFEETTQAWIELIKDIVAMANTHGGLIIIGVHDDGSPTIFDSSYLELLDNTTFIDKIFKYTNCRLSGLKVYPAQRKGSRVFVIEIAPRDIPIIFTSPGEYEVKDKEGKTIKKSAFPVGSIYFRHSARSDPGTSDDLARWLTQNLKEYKDNLMNGIVKVIDAPRGSDFQIIPRNVHATDSKVAFNIRITDDPSAPTYTIVNADKLFPYRQFEIIAKLKTEGININQHDFLLYRIMNNLDSNPDLSHKLAHSSRNYSARVIDIIKNEYQNNSKLFLELRNMKREKRGPFMV